MKKINLIYFITLIGLFVTYHFVYIFLNQSSTVNSDTIWSYSFARDIIENNDIRQFSFPPLYYFLDIVISFLPSLFGDHVIHSMIVAPTNIIIFIIFFCYFFKINQNLDLFKTGILFILSTILVYFAFIILSYIFSELYQQNIYPLLSIKNYFFMQGNHGLSSVAALVISYFFYFFKPNSKNRILLYLFTFIFSLSDFWFAVYFLPIVGFYFLLKPNKKIFREILFLTILASSALLINYFFNENLSDYKLTKNNNDKVVGIINIFIVIYLLPFLCTVYLYLKKKLSDFFKSILFGSLISFIFIYLTDNHSYLNMRFFVFILPIYILLFFEIIKFHLLEIKKLFLITFLLITIGFMQLITFNITDKKMRNENTHFEFSDEISCIQKINQNKTYYVVSDYWPSKVIFESLDRKINLIAPQWIYNPLWSILNENANGLIVVKFKMYPDGNMHKELKNFIESKEANSREICKNKLIVTDNFKLKK